MEEEYEDDGWMAKGGAEEEVREKPLYLSLNYT
jgi:hypothetical protein